MPTRDFVNRRDLLFWLYEVGDPQLLSQTADGQPLSRNEVESMLDAVTKLADAEFEGLPALLDAQEPSFDRGKVWTHPRLKTALDAYRASGFHSAAFAERWGGMSLPYTLGQVLGIPCNAQGGSGIGYLFLTAAAAAMLEIMGDESQKQLYLPKLVSGEWFGTMMLSEPQAGSSVGDIRTRAVAQADGSYHLHGSKMWISGGDHELADNIIHMVLAKIEGPDGVVPGTKGISLFLVPKFLPDVDGRPGRRNGVQLSGINHKMGNRGMINTVPVLGGEQPCVGYLLGEPGKGLAGMFHMMNEARVGVGMGAAQYGYFGYRYSLSYARERTQGRPIDRPDPAAPPVPIIQHADIKRLLLKQKALTEGAMALCLHAAELIDRTRLGDDETERREAATLLAILTPVVKTWPSVWGTRANDLAIQVLGGYGYTREYPVERLLRDNRLNEIHEGTTGIQGLDLLGRKVPQDQGAGAQLLMRTMLATAEAAREIPELQAESDALANAIERLALTTQTLMQAAAGGQRAAALANSTIYLDMTGHTVVAWHWLRMALTALRALPEAAEIDRPFYRGKIRACRYFYRYELPATQSQAELLAALDETCLAAAEDEF